MIFASSAALLGFERGPSAMPRKRCTEEQLHLHYVSMRGPRLRRSSASSVSPSRCSIAGRSLGSRPEDWIHRPTIAARNSPCGYRMYGGYIILFFRNADSLCYVCKVLPIPSLTLKMPERLGGRELMFRGLSERNERTEARSGSF